MERNFNFITAEKRVLKFLESKKIHYRVFEEGEIYKTHFCRLFLNSVLISEGMGKGKNEASKIGAIFEALEHYVSEHPEIFLSEIFSIDSEELYGGLLSEDYALSASKKYNSSGKMINCIKILNYKKEVCGFYPIEFIFPNSIFINEQMHYTSKIWREYTSNNGTAIGCDIDEAILHALNEKIERDSKSIFMANILTNSQIKIIKPASLPDWFNFLKI